ncbi:MAG: hypothetical protein LBC90_09835, partial [Candidatus Adiutrix sp.]|nr:hypothetical protein [Candidatus Adiutrix sp.]
MAVIRYFYSAGSLKRVSLFLVLVAALFSLAGPALAGETAPDLQPPLAKKVFTPKYHPIGVMVDEFKKLATPRGKILAIGNDIYVEDEPKAIATMSQTFERLDRVNRYILIEHRVVAVKSDFLEELEVNWEKADHLAFGNLNRAAGRRLDDRLSAAEAVGEARVIYGSPPRRAISSPRITAASGQTVSIKQGRLWGEETSTTVANIELQQVV